MAPSLIILEDEPILRLFTAQTLEEAGYTVIPCATYEQGLNALLTTPDILAVFSDYDLGEGNAVHTGRHIYEAVRTRISKTLPFLAVSNTMAYWEEVQRQYPDVNLHLLPKHGGEPEVYVRKLTDLGLTP